LNDNENSLLRAIEGQVAGLTLAIIRIAKACPDPAAVAGELEVASGMFSDGSPRSEGAALMLRLISNAIRQDGAEPAEPQ
jgi:hypothetical protein